MLDMLCVCNMARTHAYRSFRYWNSRSSPSLLAQALRINLQVYKGHRRQALSMLALISSIGDPEGMRDLTSYMKDLLKGLRELKKSSVVALEMLKVFSKGNDSSNGCGIIKN